MVIRDYEAPPKRLLSTAEADQTASDGEMAEWLEGIRQGNQEAAGRKGRLFKPVVASAFEPARAAGPPPPEPPPRRPRPGEPVKS